MRTSPVPSAVRQTAIASLAAIAIFTAGCNSNDSAPDTSKVAVLDPTVTKSSSHNLLDLYNKLDNVYETEMKPTDDKVSPEAKKVVEKISDGKDVRADLARDHNLFADGIETVKRTMIDLGNNTSANVDPMEHDKYVAYFTVIGEALSARQAEYQAFLDYEKNPNSKTKQAVLDVAKVVQGKDLAYNVKKR